jgi:hypothetical protein
MSFKPIVFTLVLQDMFFLAAILSGSLVMKLGTMVHVPLQINDGSGM